MWKRILEILGHEGPDPSEEEFIEDWKKKPEYFFVGQFDEELKWGNPLFDRITLDGASDSHGLMIFPKMKISATFASNEYTLGWVEELSMVEGGVVRIKHFALRDNLEGQGIGSVFYNAILSYFKKRHATSVEFHENHSTKIDYYRSFFKKQGVKEVREQVWRVDLYPNGKIPLKVRIFQKAIKMKVLNLKH
jgi:GNAT superfamily N-acetyltransferase